MLPARRWTPIVLLGLTLAVGTPRDRVTGGTAQPLDDTARDASLTVTLSSPAADGDHPLDHPLLFLVSLADPAAANARTHNALAQAVREQLTAGRADAPAPDERERLQKMATAVPVPSTALGSEAEPAWTHVSFEWSTASGTVPSPAVRPLETTQRSARVVRLEQESGWFAFGVDVEPLSAMRADTYTIRAVLDTRRRSGMWRGRVASEPVVIRLRAAGAERSEPAAQAWGYAAGRFYLLDRQFRRAHETADRLLARDPASVAAFELQGDALVGLDRLDEASRAFAAGIAAFQDRVAALPVPSTREDVDHPTYLIERLREVRRLRASR